MFLPKGKTEELINQILVSRRISRLEQQMLMSSLLSKDTIDGQEQNLIDQVFYGIRNGLVRVVD
jgi:hypothetical protein